MLARRADRKKFPFSGSSSDKPAVVPARSLADLIGIDTPQARQKAQGRLRRGLGDGILCWRPEKPTRTRREKRGRGALLTVVRRALRAAVPA